ncbi:MULTISPECIES: hypothetical protein [Pimelobacter]|uniref:hypothetical protein n=1 Tax=Pimelobacter TaxID=2044 RepID=UPI001C04285B|nr:MULTISPECIES: hypothetical protein [Pimelobacter]UUW90259.1 hypothetical protein M0M43_01890 [Pimelobacter simplex]UUW94088.1 hypothetical protein M0M48_20400 [Pimelobacter simplex]
MSSDYFTNAETSYRRQLATRGMAASRAGRTRSSWLRRIAAADPSIERRSR